MSSIRNKSIPSHIAGPPIAISQNWIGGAGAIELRRGNRLIVFDDLVGELRPPPDFFDLSSADENAADKLTATLVTPSTVQPFKRFSISWEVKGPQNALARVESLQLMVFSFGPISNLSYLTSLTPEGVKKAGSVDTSMWQSGSIRLWAHFRSGIRELEVVEVTVDTSRCKEETKSPSVLSAELQVAANTKFLERVREEAGEDVTVEFINSPIGRVSNDGFSVHMDLMLITSRGTLIVRLGMQFMMSPKAGNLGAVFSLPGYKSVVIEPELPWHDDFWHLITLGEHNLSSYQHKFTVGLQELADDFASVTGWDMRGLPEEFTELQEANAPKVIATAIDISNDKFIITLCPVERRLVSVGGIFSEKAIIRDP